ncbi:hypothetical protein FDP41_009944 [Naegleria fowleri]|uniref:Uncharacterized protein n=1 Tax=Naegleria fowleri TaxID=5763 RepID=A0A6A5B9U4_NAEFO|nr:uncharacterized protein FDP41_009944 [Naegleria fowleri]KAF0971721.1 hypothetical protein FDP41_009944 [Naegleria fowleri]CAG4710537.1 unnamed protein product [Naegleria fowleri]
MLKVDASSIDELLREIDQTVYEHPKHTTREIPFQIKGTGIVGDVTLFNVGFQHHPEVYFAKAEQQGKEAFSSTHIPFSPNPSPSNFMKENYLTPKLENDKEDYRIFPRLFKPNELYSFAVSKPKYVIETFKDPFTGKIKECKEVYMPQVNDTSKTSTSLLRQPAASKDFVRGNSHNVPFEFGGIDREEEKGIELALSRDAAVDNAQEKPHSNIFERSIQEELELLKLQSENNMEAIYGIESCPPGFKHGLFQSAKQTVTKQKENHNADERLDIEAMTIGKNQQGLLDAYKQDISNYDLSNEGEVFMSVEQQRELRRRQEMKSKKQELVNFTDIFSSTLSEDVFGSTEESGQVSEETTSQQQPVSLPPQQDMESKQDGNKIIVPSQKKAKDTIDDLLEADEDVLFSSFIRKQGKKQKDNEYAIMTRIDVSNFKQMVPEMAIQYPFDLDIFQKEAIYHLENNESVFVSAHTSAGKTVVAEYAIALAQKHLTRVIYTSPIKTLSNQKFREFKKTFGDVGILTGDVQINPTATCLIMTTEILRSMLYKGADLIRDVEFVIFDEVHYVNDPERGVVWEEVIIMLPKHINLILLSATIPNTYEFADWVGRTKKKPIHVIQTLKRPVPLEHHLYYNGNIYKIVDSTSKFLSAGYRSALTAQEEKEEKSKNKGGFKKTPYAKLIETLNKKSLLPAVTFVFSRKQCEEIAVSLQNTDLNEPGEKNEIHKFISQSISRLKGTDKELPQIIRISELLKRGIGIHHSGLLPIVKEIVEILFSKGLIKILFATETFAMGVNTPTKTVVFNTLWKFDGKDKRDLLPGEYIQMSGRAGRRGLDTVGNVIINCASEIPEEPLLQRLILGKATQLESKFKLSYNMILNLMRVEDFKIQDMIKRSFSESKTLRIVPNKELLLKSKEKLAEIEKIDCINGEPAIDQFYALARELEDVNQKITTEIMISPKINALTTFGRVVVVRYRLGYTLGVILRQESSTLSTNRDEKYYSILGVRLNPSFEKRKQIIPIPTQTGLAEFSPILLPQSGEISTIIIAPYWDILTICNEKLNLSLAIDELINNGTSKETSEMRAAANQLINLWKENPPTPINAIKELKLTSLDFSEALSKRQQLITKLQENKCNICPKLAEHFDKTDKQYKIKQGLDKLRFALSDENLELMPEVRKRIKVLKILKYVDADETVQLKGRVACELNSCDELLVTEMIFENFFTTMSCEEAVAVMSCLVCQSRGETEEPTLTKRLQELKDKVSNLALSLGQLQMENGLDTSPTDYLSKTLNFSMMEVAYEWAMGQEFKDICALTSIPEGTIVRTISQLDQALRDVRNAARIIGDINLYQKMEESSRKIRRDIIFAASLFLFPTDQK